MNTELEIIQDYIKRGFVPALAAQEIHPIPKHVAISKGMQIDNSKPVLLMQIINPKNSPRKCVHFIFQNEETHSFVENWRRSFIDYTKYRLELCVKFFKSKNNELDSPIVENINASALQMNAGKYADCVAENIPNEPDSVRLTYLTKCASTSIDVHMKEIDLFEKRVSHLLISYSVFNNVGYAITHRHICKPETYYKVGPGEIATPQITDAVTNFANLFPENESIIEVCNMLANLNRQMSLRSKILLGHIYIEKIFYDKDSIPNVFKIGKPDIRNLSDHLLTEGNAWLRQASSGNGNTLQRDSFHQVITKLMSSKIMNKQNAIALKLEELLDDSPEVKQTFVKLDTTRHTLAHTNKPINQKTLNECVDFIDIVLKRHIEKNAGVRFFGKNP